MEAYMHGLLENDWMFSGRGVVPWHGIGAALDGALTSGEANQGGKTHLEG
jgi:hypothetical protein